MGIEDLGKGGAATEVVAVSLWFVVPAVVVVLAFIVKAFQFTQEAERHANRPPTKKELKAMERKRAKSAPKGE